LSPSLSPGRILYFIHREVGKTIQEMYCASRCTKWGTGGKVLFEHPSNVSITPISYGELRILIPKVKYGTVGSKCYGD